MICELSDLPVEWCAHCQKSDKPIHEYYDPASDRDIDFYKKSDRPGNCVCGQKFTIGDMLGWDKDAKWWRAEKCCG